MHCIAQAQQLRQLSSHLQHGTSPGRQHNQRVISTCSVTSAGSNESRPTPKNGPPGGHLPSHGLQGTLHDYMYLQATLPSLIVAAAGGVALLLHAAAATSVGGDGGRFKACTLACMFACRRSTLAPQSFACVVNPCMVLACDCACAQAFKPPQWQRSMVGCMKVEGVV